MNLLGDAGNVTVPPTASWPVLVSVTNAATYLNSVRYALTVWPPGNLGFYITNPLFNTESGYDYFTLYAGRNTLAPVLIPRMSGTRTGTALFGPFRTAPGVPIYAVFTSDSSVVYSGCVQR